MSITIQEYRKLTRKRPRYTAKRGTLDGFSFASQAEMQRYKDLKLMQAGGVIGGLKVHPRYDLHVCGEVIGFVELDFEYWDMVNCCRIYEDVKSKTKNTSTRTPIYRWKARHFKAEYGIEIREVL